MIDLDNIFTKSPHLVITVFQKMSKESFMAMARSSRRSNRFIENITSRINRPIFVQTLILGPNVYLDNTNRLLISEERYVTLKRLDGYRFTVLLNDYGSLEPFRGAKVYHITVHGLWTEKEKVLNILNYLGVKSVHELRIGIRIELGPQCEGKAKLHAKYYHWLCTRIQVELIDWFHPNVSLLDNENVTVRSRLLGGCQPYDDKAWTFLDEKMKYLYIGYCEEIVSTSRLQNLIKGWNERTSSLDTFSIGVENGSFDIDYERFLHSFTHFEIYSKGALNPKYTNLILGTDNMLLPPQSPYPWDEYDRDIARWYAKLEFQDSYRKIVLILKSRAHPNRFAFVYLSPTAIYLESVDRWKVDKIFTDYFLPFLKKKSVPEKFEQYKNPRAAVWDEIFSTFK